MDCLLCYHVLLMVFGSISFCLLWVSYATPGWLAVTFQEQEAFREWTVSSLNKSLWYDIVCPQELYDCKTCKVSDTEDCVLEMGFPNYTSHYYWMKVLQENKEQWVLWRVLMTVAVVCCAIGFIFLAFLVCCRLRTGPYRTLATIAFLLWLIPAILVWVPVAMDADMHVDIKDDVDDNIPHDSTLHIPYSIIIAAIGAFVALIVALMLLWLTGVCSTRRAEKSETDSLSYDSRTRITEHVKYEHAPHMYPYYIQEERPNMMYYREEPPTYVREAPPTIIQQAPPTIIREAPPTVIQEPTVIREPYVVRAAEATVMENPGYRGGERIVRNFPDDRSQIYSERWYDNKSNI